MEKEKKNVHKVTRKNIDEQAWSFITYLISCHLINSFIANVSGTESRKNNTTCIGKLSIVLPSSFQNLQNTVPENAACAHNL